MKFMLDIKNQQDWELLKPLVERLGISYERVFSEEEKLQDKRDWEIIRKGAHIENFEEFYEQWKQDRKGRKFISPKEQIEKNWETLMKGIKFDDFEKFMADFEEYRKDPPRPFRD